MPIRSLLKYLMNNEQLVQKLADSNAVRKAAKLSIALFYRSKEKMSELDPQQISKLKSFFEKFTSNLREGIEDAKKQLKK